MARLLVPSSNAGSGGYETVFGTGEVGFGGYKILIAYKNGQLLGNDGFARIVASGDKEGGRFVFNSVKIEVRTVANSFQW
jgi:hypothetical protein